MCVCLVVGLTLFSNKWVFMVNGQHEPPNPPKTPAVAHPDIVYLTHNRYSAVAREI